MTWPKARGAERRRNRLSPHVGGLLLSLVLAACTNASAPPADAEAKAAESSPSTVMSVLNLFDAAVSVPQPIWRKDVEHASEESEYLRHAEGPFFMLEEIPKGDAFEKWSKIYVVRGLYAPKLSFDAHLNLALSGWVGACGKDNLTVVNPIRRPQFFRAIIVCQNSPHGNPQIGYGDGVGEVSILEVEQFESTYLSVWQSWRGKSFDATKTETWPVPVADVQEMLRRFQGIRMIPAPKEDVGQYPPGVTPPTPPAPAAPKK